MGHKIAFWSKKGSQGKTTLATSMYYITNHKYITNEPDNDISQILGENKVFTINPNDNLPDIKKASVIYDLGGYLDNRLGEILQTVDCVVIPVIPKNQSILEKTALLKSVRDVMKFNKNIVIVINAIESKEARYCMEIKKLVNQYYSFPIYDIKYSTAFSHSLNENKSIEQLIKDNVMFKHHYTKPLNQLNKLIDHLMQY